uniref:Rab-GAP TBC domain-containing protein n=1 Tax=Syphacia muris TaxID=451379 RepID=A0A0N5AFP2_9BILA
MLTPVTKPGGVSGNRLSGFINKEIVSLSSRSSLHNNEEGCLTSNESSQVFDADQAEEISVQNNNNETNLPESPNESMSDELMQADKNIVTPYDIDLILCYLILQTQSTFYLNANGELNARSLQMPSPISSSAELLKNAEDLVNKIESQAKTKVEESARNVIGKAKASLRFPSFSGCNSGRSSCEQCKILLGIVNDLKDRCYELTDEVGANQELVVALRQALMKANSQVDKLKALVSMNTPEDRVNFILDRECEITTLQINAAANLRSIQALREKNWELEQRNVELNSAVEAFRDSVRTKEELIIKLCGEHGDALGNEGPVPVVDDIEVPEGILVDFGSSTDEGTQKVFDEAAVNDIAEMRDLVNGYQSQNMFLNQEVLELQKIVSALEERERRFIRQNFDIEACYYQLKSRYIMVLNHFRTENQANSRVLEPGVIEELIDETNWVANRRVCGNEKLETRLTNSLGFYLNSDSRHRRICSMDLLDVAAELKNKSEEIAIQQELEQTPQYINWLQRWDSFLVNYVTRPLKPSADLKELIRSGVPKTYRRRVWKSLLNYLISDEQADLGNGYYQSMLRKYNTQSKANVTDDIIKQIDLDLVRTLPNNRYFDEPESPKINSLRRVLYAYRFHNKTVGYCQGLNRLAAIALLFLDEADAFWFLVACVEHLQPVDYYTPTLIGAVADQKVLRDLVGEKLPKLSQHLKKLEVDLPVLTLSWFLTCFVDTFPHDIYLRIFDAFLYEGNKVLFRFALATLKIAEAAVLECKTVGAAHALLSNVSEQILDYKTLARVAFVDLNPFPLKGIETKRQFYLSQLHVSG